MGFIFISLICRWPIWILLIVTCRFIKPFNYLFLVYPGTDKDLDGYCPRWLAKSFIFSKKPSIGGIITGGSSGRGLILVVPNTTKEFIRNKETCIKIMRRLNRIRCWVGAKGIAVAGQGPSIFRKHGINFVQPFVEGRFGRTFCVIETLNRIIEEHNLIVGNFSIAVVGVGYLGNFLIENLKKEGHVVTGIDIFNSKKGVVLMEGSQGILSKSDLIIVHTPKGSDFYPYLKFLKKECIVVDDTHPKIKKRIKNIKFYKVAVGLDNVNFVPRLPGYRTNWIPGCTVEAHCCSSNGKFRYDYFKDFYNDAIKIGFYAHMVQY